MFLEKLFNLLLDCLTENIINKLLFLEIMADRFDTVTRRLHSESFFVYKIYNRI